MTFSDALESVAAGESAVAAFYDVEVEVLPLVDEVKVVFDGKYSLTYRKGSLGISHNICSIDEYVYSENDSMCTYTFTFTAADYGYAVENGETVQEEPSVSSSGGQASER